MSSSPSGNEPFTANNLPTGNERPAERPVVVNDVYFGSSPVLESEDTYLYEKFVGLAIDFLKPVNIIEMIWVRDVIDLQWDIDRMRRAKAALIDIGRREALETVLRPLRWLVVSGPGEQDGEEYDLSNPDDLLDWLILKGENLETAADLLEKKGQCQEAASLRQNALLANGVSRKIDVLERLDRMIMTMEARRDNALRELDRRRAGLGRRTRRALVQVEDAEFQEVEETPAEQKQAA